MLKARCGTLRGPHNSGPVGLLAGHKHKMLAPAGLGESKRPQCMYCLHKVTVRGNVKHNKSSNILTLIWSVTSSVTPRSTTLICLQQIFQTYWMLFESCKSVQWFHCSDVGVAIPPVSRFIEYPYFLIGEGYLKSHWVQNIIFSTIPLISKWIIGRIQSRTITFSWEIKLMNFMADAFGFSGQATGLCWEFYQEGCLLTLPYFKARMKQLITIPDIWYDRSCCMPLVTHVPIFLYIINSPNPVYVTQCQLLDLLSLQRGI